VFGHYFDDETRRAFICALSIFIGLLSYLFGYKREGITRIVSFCVLGVMLAFGLFLSYQYGGIAQAFNYVFVCVAMWFSYLCLYFMLFYCFLESDNKIKILHFIAKLSVAVIVCVFLSILLG